MQPTQAYKINSTNQEITIQLNKNLIEPEKLEKFLDYLFLIDIQQKSQLTEASADELIKEIKQSCWEQQQSLFTQ